MKDATDTSGLHFRAVTYSGIDPGPRLIVTGAVHGNETCGTRAIERAMREIAEGVLKIAAGTVTFVPVTNPLAYAKRDRLGDRNLNRNLAPNPEPRDFEDRVANWLCPLLERHDVLLDLHSTRAASQPFASLGPRDNGGTLEPFALAAKERALATRLGVSRFIEGWLATYARGVENRRRGGYGGPLNSDSRYGVGTTEFMRSTGGCGITLECGQHDDPGAVDVAYQGIRSALAFLGITADAAPAPVESYEALRLQEVIDRLHPDDRFSRAWSSFDPVRAGDVIGVRHDGTEVRVDRDGWIVFPDAGARPGHEWFYFAEKVDRL